MDNKQQEMSQKINAELRAKKSEMVMRIRQAETLEERAKRVDEWYQFCQENGLPYLPH